MKDIKGLIFSIEEFSVFDGPGIRTTVFLKGCPLKCSWCHNPEGQRAEREIVQSPNGCLHCGKCEERAKVVTGDTELIEECIEVCPRNLIRVSGQEYTAHELSDMILKNSVFYKESGGGVTFSGGEPLFQHEFLYECLKTLKNKVKRCIQTSGFCSEEVFRQILSETDLFLFDLKVIDREKALKYTGADISVILKNLDILVKSCTQFIIRLPLIPSVTDTEENIGNIIKILKSYNIDYAEALPYNKMAGAKYKLCGRKYLPDFDETKEVYIPENEFKQSGITLKIL